MHALEVIVARNQEAQAAHDAGIRRPEFVVECRHQYIEAVNYGQEHDNVECGRCGQLWVRFDRIVDRPSVWRAFEAMREALGFVKDAAQIDVDDGDLALKALHAIRIGVYAALALAEKVKL